MANQSGFGSGGRNWGAGVTVRRTSSGATWAWRSARNTPHGPTVAPGSVCVPLSCPFGYGAKMAKALAFQLPKGWRVSVRAPHRCAWVNGCVAELRVVFPAGLQSSQVRAVLHSAGLQGV